jgi:hypothetical protein
MILDNNTMEMMIMSTMTPTEFAATVDSTGREVRKFLRSITPREEQPGKGSRWELPGTKREVTKLQKQFADWNKKQLEDRAARAQAAADEANTEVDETETELDD